MDEVLLRRMQTVFHFRHRQWSGFQRSIGEYLTAQDLFAVKRSHSGWTLRLAQKYPKRPARILAVA